MPLGNDSAYRDEKSEGNHDRLCKFWFSSSCRIYIAMAWSCHRDCSASLFCILCHLMHNGYFWWQVRDTAIHSLGNQSNLRSIFPHRYWFNNTSLFLSCDCVLVICRQAIERGRSNKDWERQRIAVVGGVNKPFCRLLTKLVMLR